MPMDFNTLSAEERATFAEWQQKVSGTNISEKTLLATDYLNHFNEIIMLIGMIPDMPELLEECRQWHPKSYQDHFRDSTFSDKELAIAAYDHVPLKYRQPFEETIQRINEAVTLLLDQIGRIIEEGQMELIDSKAKSATIALQKMQDFASAIIHGAEGTLSQDEIDKLVN